MTGKNPHGAKYMGLSKSAVAAELASALDDAQHGRFMSENEINVFGMGLQCESIGKSGGDEFGK